jgi:hypothetical protein
MKHFCKRLLATIACSIVALLMWASPPGSVENDSTTTLQERLVYRSNVLRQETPALFALEVEHGMGKLFFLLGERLFFVETTKLTNLIQQEHLIPEEKQPLAACALYDQHTTSSIYWARLEGQQLRFYKGARTVHTYLLPHAFLEEIRQPEPEPVNPTIDCQFLLHQYDTTQRLLLAVADELFVVDQEPRYSAVNNIPKQDNQRMAEATLQLKKDSVSYPIWSEWSGNMILVHSPFLEHPKRFSLSEDLRKKMIVEEENADTLSKKYPDNWKAQWLPNTEIQLFTPAEVPISTIGPLHYAIGDYGTLKISTSCVEYLDFSDSSSIISEKRLVHLDQFIALQGFENVTPSENFVWYKVKQSEQCYTFRFQLTTPIYTAERQQELQQLEAIVQSLHQSD